VPEAPLCGQVSRNSVNHTQLEFGYECESVHGLVASIEVASDSIELLSFRYPSPRSWGGHTVPKNYSFSLDQQ
jgi:hypothetical protein